MEASQPSQRPASTSAIDIEGGDPDFNPAPDYGRVVEQCPKCQGKLVDPNGLGWCKACGYCKSLEADKAAVPLETEPQTGRESPSTLGMTEFGQCIAKLPGWAKVLLGVAVAVIALNVAALLYIREPLARALWSTGEIVLGMVMILAAQIWALCILAPHDDKLNFKDAILPGRLWSMTAKKAAIMREPVWLASWGLTCILSAVLVVGGLAHWMDYLPKKPSTPPVATQPE